MKPLRIEFEAFGSYPGTVDVNFQDLAPRGLFVITGATGTGKTTIFDAMVFALYGTMPLKESNDIRSHHASADARTWVRFTFEVDGVCYRVERSPEYLRPKQKGTGFTKETASATVVRIEADGSTTPITTRASDAAKFCTDLLGLSPTQFTRVMLLPQGDVTRFLLDKSDDREELLGQLFGGEVYERIVYRLKSEADAAKAEVADVEEDERRLLANAVDALHEVIGLVGAEPLDGVDALDADQVGSLLESTVEARRELAERSVRATEAATAAEQLAQQARDSADRFDRAIELRGSSAELAAATAGVESAERAARVSAAARPVVTAADEAARAESVLEQHRRDRDGVCASLSRIAAEVGVTIDVSSATEVVRTIANAVDGNAARQSLIEHHRSAAEALELAEVAVGMGVTELEKAAAALAAAEDELAAVGAALNELEPRRRDLDQLGAITEQLARARRDRDALDRLLTDQATCRSAAESAGALHDQLWQQFVATQAPRLAAELRDGDPCPVCGSCEHPAPALDPSAPPVSYDDVTAAQDEMQRRATELQAVADDIAAARSALGELADVPAGELDDRIAAHSASVAEATAVEDDHVRLVGARTALEVRIAGCTEARVAAATRLEGLHEARDARSTELELAAAQCAGIDGAEVDRVAAALEQCSELATGIDDLFSAVASAAALATARRGDADDGLGASEFTSVDEARAALLDPVVEADHLAAAVTHRAELDRVTTSLATLLELGVPDERPDADALGTTAVELRQAAAELDRRTTTLGLRASDCADALEKRAAVTASNAAVRRRAEVARRAYVVCAGQGAIKMNLRRWVLGNELDRVTAAATVHLGRMTAGRYGIRRMLEAQNAKSAFGLDLEIVDAHTGRPRRPRSLSGGEQFQASLALALGLADVVSLGGTGSGRRMEALFVDEGFGSLDPAALDDAIETLHQLQASGRMVGAITHVETMKERLHVGIAVEALDGGKGSRLTVRP